MISISFLFEEEYKVPMIDREKEKHLNPKTNRIKTFKHVKHLVTDIPPEKRDFKNLPRYSTKKPKVRFQDWLEINAQKRHPSHTALSWGWAPNGKAYGWSHRAVHGFAVGDTVKPGDIAHTGKKPFVLKTKAAVEKHAKAFADDVS